jgi:hypothetical protein
MNELTIELVGRGTRWNFSKREIRIGRDQTCDLVLGEQYSMISRSHLLVRLESDQCWIEDLGTSGGTFANGKRIQRAPLASGDVVRLASDGPELRVYFRATTPAPYAAAEMSRSESQSFQHPADAKTQIQPGSQKAAAAYSGGGAAQASARQSSERWQELTPAPLEHKDSSGRLSMPDASSGSDASSEGRFSKRDAAMMEQKIKSIRNLLTFAIILIVILVGIVLNQNRVIENNRLELMDMRKDAVERLMPALHQRLAEFEARLNKSQGMLEGLDGRIHEAENRFVKRIESELPALLDRELPKILNKYIDQKLQQLPKPISSR